MRIKGWELTVGVNGTSRGARHADDGTVAWIQGRLIASCDCPADVVDWLMRRDLEEAWRQGAEAAGYAERHNLKPPTNPYAGEPPNKDHEPS